MNDDQTITFAIGPLELIDMGDADKPMLALVGDLVAHRAADCKVWDTKVMFDPTVRDRMTPEEVRLYLHRGWMSAIANMRKMIAQEDANAEADAIRIAAARSVYERNKRNDERNSRHKRNSRP